MSAEQAETTMWSNPADHFRPNMKILSMYSDRNYNVQYWIDFKAKWLSVSYLPWWTPLYQAGLWLSQRNRNLLLVENHMNYRPYKWRRNTEDGAY